MEMTQKGVPITYLRKQEKALQDSEKMFGKWFGL